VVIPTIQLTLQEVQHGEDCAHFPAMRYCIQARIMLEDELARIAIVFDNPKNYALVLYVSIEPSKNNVSSILKNIFRISYHSYVKKKFKV